MSETGWPTRSPRVRFSSPVVLLLTCPLLLLPALALLPIVDAFRLQEARGWPVPSAELLTLRKEALRDAVLPTPRSEGIVERQPTLPLFELRLSPGRLAALTADLPESGLLERKATLARGKLFQAVKLRLRGDNAFHWFFPKRSWRLKLQKDEPLAAGRTLHLINPKDRQVVGQLMSSLLAQEFDLLTSPAQPALVTINGRFQGLYVVQADIDETLLRRLGRLPGDVFEGDPSRRADRVEPYRTYLTEPSTWRRAATGPPEPASIEPALSRLIRLLNAGTYWNQEVRPLDEPYFARFLAFVALLGTAHYDSIHNLILYLDPLTGAFQQFEWDSEGGPFNDRAPTWIGPDVASNLIFQELLANPSFREQKDAFLHRVVTDGALLARLDEALVVYREQLTPWIERDSLDRRSFNFRGPATPAAGIEQWRRFLTERAAFLRGRLEQGSLRFARDGQDLLLIVDGGPPWLDLTLTWKQPRWWAAGHIPIREPGAKSASHYAAGQVGDRRSARVQDLTLYPGRAPRGTLRSGQLELGPTPQVYRLEGVATGLVAVEARNARTRTWVEATPHTGPLPTRSPWRTAPPPDDRFRPKVHHFGGFPPPHSLLSRVPVRITGTPARPITIDRKTIALLGSGAAGSRFRHVVFQNGIAGRIDGVNLLGGVNLHETRDVVFEDCVFVRTDPTVKTEDMLRVARSTGVTLTRCRFVNAYSDALDVDLSQITVRDCTFERPGNDAIDLMGSPAHIVRCSISGAGDKGISIGEGSHPRVIDTTVRDCAIAVQVKDGSDPLLVGCRLSGQVAVHSYAKNWRYADGGHGRIVNSIVTGPVRAQKHSDLQLITCRLNATPRGAVAVVERGADRTPDRRVERELGLAPAAALGPAATRRTLTPLRPLWSHRFRDDLTSSLAGWSLEPPLRRGPSRWFVARDGLALRRRTGQALSLRWSAATPVPFAQAGLFALEAKADVRVEAVVVVTTDRARREPVRLGPRFVRHLIPIDAGALLGLEVQIPSGSTHVTIRRVELLSSP